MPRTHTGVLQGNAAFGAMIWGEANVLRLTVGRVDYWDHRGGLAWTEEQSYANIRACLEAGDEEGLRRLFEETQRPEGVPRRPSVLPIGRFDVDLGPGARLETAVLDIDSGEVAVQVCKAGEQHVVRLVLDAKRSLLWVKLPAKLKSPVVRRVPAWEYVGDYLEQIDFQPPQLFDGDEVSGWTQMRPVDETLAAGYGLAGGNLLLTAVCGADAGKARAAAGRLLRRGRKEGWGALRRRNKRWWSAYWGDVARVEVPNEKLRFLYEYGMYKFAGLTNPSGVAATLQGAWVEEYQMPPWSNDYHFNINVQMCYWPAYHGNRLEHLRPLFALIEKWMPVLRHNARVFLGIKDGLMLPHAVDDRCTCMGGFWTGSIDHGCTAWVAQMMYRYYRYTMDEAFLRQTAYPFMVGAMRVYEEMLERQGDAFVLPVSVSPEYRGSRMDAWGANASFQLACIHRLCKDLLEAATVLKKRPRPIWKEIRRSAPKACLIGNAGEEQIALWEGTALEESHRHHSHLAGIAPFDIIDLDDEKWRGIVERSLHHWIRIGPGLWSGWGVPWASMIHTRAGNADAAELWLEIWQRLFTNEGHGTLHDVDFPGFSLMGKGASLLAVPERGEIMQIEAGMSCIAAIQEILLYVRNGVNHLFGGAPRSWKQVGFRGVRTDGAFLVSARRVGGKVGQVEVKSLVGGVFRLANPWGGEVLVQRGRRSEIMSGEVLEIGAKKGEVFKVGVARSRK